MTTIETEKKISPNSAERLFNFLTDMNNFERLMPADRIEKWSATQDQCEFTIKGMTRIGLKIVSSEEYSKLVIESFGKVPFSFNLNISLVEQAANETEVSMIFNGDINPFMKMMVEKPLTNFFNMLVDKATELSL